MMNLNFTERSAEQYRSNYICSVASQSNDEIILFKIALI